MQCCEETTPRGGLYRSWRSGGHAGQRPQVGTGTGHLHEALCVCVTAWCTYVLEPSSAFSGDTRGQEEPCARGEVRCKRLGRETQVMLSPQCPVGIAWR